jgi:chaperonin GroEL
LGQIKEKDDPKWGFNALTNEFEDLEKAGVIEPAKVAIAALVNSASVASMILTTECLVTDAPEKENEGAAAAGAGMGGGMPGMM